MKRGRRILARDLKAASESLRRIFCFIEPTAKWQRIICSSMGKLLAMMKKRVAAAAVVIGVMVMGRAGLSWRRSHMKTVKAKTSAASSSSTPSFTQFMAGQCWIGQESFQHRHNFGPPVLSCNFKGCVVFAITVFPYLVLDVSKITATCNEPLNYFMLSIMRGPQWSASPAIFLRDIDTRILQQHLNNGHLGRRTTKWKWSGSISSFKLTLMSGVPKAVWQLQHDHFLKQREGQSIGSCLGLPS